MESCRSERSQPSRTIERTSRWLGHSPEAPGWPSKRASPQELSRGSWTIKRASQPTLFSNVCQCAGLEMLGRSRPKLCFCNAMLSVRCFKRCLSCARLESAGIKNTSVGLRLRSRDVLSRALEMVPSASASRGALAMQKIRELPGILRLEPGS